MTRRKGERTAQMNERDFPLELRLPDWDSPPHLSVIRRIAPATETISI
jgi:hypothetical protein